jgi:hypothetical protein
MASKTVKKVAFVIPYFGELPQYFPLFMASIIGKPVDILFFSDTNKPNNLPPNVIWNHITFSELIRLFSQKLGVEVTFSKPYKLCDIKPFYGFLFQDFLKDYDFWGSIDTDTILGNFENFIPDKILSEIDFYSGIKEYVSGSFFLMRNNDYCNNLFKKSKDWKEVAKSQNYCCFDECGGFYFEPLKAGKNISELNVPIQSFTEVVLLEMRNGLRAMFTNVILETKGFSPVKVVNNGIWFDNKEYLLVHFIYFKMKYYFYTRNSLHQQPYYINDFGTFKHRPSKIGLIFSRNFIFAINQKFSINVNKLSFIYGYFKKRGLS